MKTLVVTGATGFIGQVFCKAAGKYFRIIRLKRNATTFPKASAVIHFAARTAKTSDDRTTIDQYRKDNVVLTQRLLEKNYRYFLYISTMDVLKIPRTAYAQSKWEAEEMVRAHCTAHTIPFCIARLGSVFGPGEGAYGKVIPTFIRNALAGKKLRANKALRRFIYIDDVVRSLLTLVKNQTTGTVIITGGEDISIQDLANRIRKIIHGDSPQDTFDRHLKREIAWFQGLPTIIFDVDGTLLDATKRIHIMRKQYRTKKERRRFIEKPEFLALDRVFPGIERLLVNLARKHRLIAVSARQKEQSLVRQLGTLELSQYFTEIIAVGPVYADRKKQRIYEELKKRYGQILIAVGDSQSDRVAAERSGIRFIPINELLNTAPIFPPGFGQ